MSSLPTGHEGTAIRMWGEVKRALGHLTRKARAHYLLMLAALYVALNAGDLISTALGLRHGMLEGNPLMSMLLAQHGFGALIAYKIGVTLVVLLGMGVLRLWNARGALGALVVCDALLCVVVCANVAQYLALVR